MEESATDATENLSVMTEDEVARHLQLCMKLAAENKINSKNAFGLHLIQLMQNVIKTESSDLQQASLSLQAGSKIYSSRVEALYQETLKFHSQLQSVVSGGKKEKNNFENNEDEQMDCADEEPTGRKSVKTKSKSYLASDTSLSTQREEGKALSLGEPHGNFAVINATFSTARTAPKLLQGCIESDACKLAGSSPQLCYKPKVGVENSCFLILPRIKGILDKIKKFAISKEELEAIVSSTNMLLTPCTSTPKPPTIRVSQNFEIFDSNDASPLMMDHNEDAPVFNSVMERLSVLDITADIFVNEIFDAVKSGKKGETIDQTLLPPNSILKKVINTSSRPSVKKTDTKKVVKKKEKFFGEQSINDVIHMFAPGRSCLLSNKALKNFKAEVTTELGTGYFEFPHLADNERSDKEKIRKIERIIGIYAESDANCYFSKKCFLKRNRILRASFGKEQSQSGTIAQNSHLSSAEMQLCGRPSSMVPEDLAYSLQNLSLNDDAAAEDNVFDQGSIEDFLPAALEEPNALEFDMNEFMVKPPELVKPANVKYDKTPVNINTEEVKQLLWGIISERIKEVENYIFFSCVYKELKKKLESGNSGCISKQFAFVILLILANEKCLCLENMTDGPDLIIKQDNSA